MATGSFLPDNLPTYEFYNPSFVAHQFGLGQLPPRLFFKNTLKPREGISEMMEASRVFQLGSDLPSFCLHEWTRATFSSNLFDSWWQEWHSHLFCIPTHPNYLAISVFKMYDNPRCDSENHHWEETSQNKIINCSGNLTYLPS